MDTKEMIEVMKAFVDGKKIEFRERGSRTWKPDENPEWDWSCIEYRIAPEAKKEGPWELVDVILSVHKIYEINDHIYGRQPIDALPRIPGFGGIDYQSPFDPKVIVRSMTPLMFSGTTGSYYFTGYSEASRPGIPVAAWFWKEGEK